MPTNSHTVEVLLIFLLTFLAFKSRAARYSKINLGIVNVEDK